MNLFLALIVFTAVGSVLWKAHQLGSGNLWLGLKRYFDADYRTDKDENTDIEHGLFLLSERLDAYFPRGWSVEFDQGQPGRPPCVRLISSSDSNRGVYLYDSPAELLQQWSQPEPAGVKGATTDIN